MDIGSTIRSHRVNRSITQKELAALVGLSECHIRHLEHNRREPSLITLRNIADVFDPDVEIKLVKK